MNTVVITIIGNIIRKINFDFKSKKSIKCINNNKPNAAFIVFDLSPVINTEKKNINSVNKNIMFLNFWFFKMSNICPNIRNIKPFIKAAAIGSSLKKLTTLVPWGSLTPSKEIAPHPKILAPKILSK